MTDSRCWMDKHRRTDDVQLNLFIKLLYMSLLCKLTLYSINTHLTRQEQTAFENIVGKEQFLLFPQRFLLNQKIVPDLSIFLTSKFYLLLKRKSPKLAYKIKG